MANQPPGNPSPSSVPLSQLTMVVIKSAAKHRKITPQELIENAVALYLKPKSTEDKLIECLERIAVLEEHHREDKAKIAQLSNECYQLAERIAAATHYLMDELG